MARIVCELTKLKRLQKAVVITKAAKAAAYAKARDEQEEYLKEQDNA